MVLVDTSVLINYLKNTNNSSTTALDFIIDNKLPYGINNFIYQELLQGSRSIQEFEKLKDYLSSLPFYGLLYDNQSYENAAIINYKCRKSGITVRSTIDLLIVQTALENGLFLLHDDNDFTNIKKVITELKIYNI